MSPNLKQTFRVWVNLHGSFPEIADEKFLLILEDSHDWLMRSMQTGRYSFGLIIEIALHSFRRFYNIFTILDEIKFLEGKKTKTHTKPASIFNKNPLLGLWHKHHFQARFIPRNLMNELSHSDAVEKFFEKHTGKYMEEVVNELAELLTTSAFEKRSHASELTGEWIIFEKSEMSHYYLTLASYKESDQEIFDRICAYRAFDNLNKADFL